MKDEVEYGEGRDREAWKWRAKTWIIMEAMGAEGTEHTGTKLLSGSQEAGAGMGEGTIQIGDNSNRSAGKFAKKKS